MKHVLVWVQHDPQKCTRLGRWRFKDNNAFPLRELKAQVDNTLYFGVKPEDIFICTNFNFNYKGATNYIIENIHQRSAWLNKCVAMNELVSKGLLTDDVWLHDLDAWQCGPLEFMSEWGDVATPIFYGPSRPHGASVFYRKTGLDIIGDVYRAVEKGGTKNDEIYMKHVFLGHGIKGDKRWPNGRWTIIDRQYCATIGQVHHITLPVKVVHYHPESGEKPGYLTPHPPTDPPDKGGWRLIDDRLIELFKQWELFPPGLTIP